MISVTRIIAETRTAVKCLPHQAALAEDVLTTLERIGAQKPVAAGTRVRFGWSLLTLREDADGLIVCEPDFSGDPFQDLRPDLSTTLDVLANQTVFVRRVGVVPADVTFDQYLVVARGSLESNVVQLFRSTPSTIDDSGWSISAADNTAPIDDPDSFEAIRSYQLLSLRPAVLPVLVLPPEFAAVMDGDVVTAVFDAQGRERLPP
jgi:hypothetical protein